MSLFLHLLIHFILAVLSGYLIGRFFNREKLGIIFGILGGFLIDLDHVLEYFMVFGARFNIVYFLESRQFLISDKIRLIFHAWEYLPLLLFIAFLFRKKEGVKVALVTLAIAGSIHLVSDVFINNYYFRYYSIVYRYQQDFEAKKLLSSQTYQLNLDYKKELGL
jgi:hypothetical protein